MKKSANLSRQSTDFQKQSANLGISSAVLLMIVVIFLAGCATPQERKERILIELGKEFTVTDNNTIYSLSNSAYVFTLGTISFTDSRCPANVVCIWAGEVGIDLKAVVAGETDSPPFMQEIHLREKTKPKESFGDPRESFGYFSITLVSIDYEKKEAVLVVDMAAGEGKAWFSISPRQCLSNAWEVWMAEKQKNLPEGMEIFPATEKQVVASWLREEFGIIVLDYAIKPAPADFATCGSCDCPRGDQIAVLVDSGNSGKMLELGWNEIGAIACTEDAKLCSDGSGVGRTAPFCEFAPCPAPTENRKGILSGKISIGPICPVERYPPEPNCAATEETFLAYPLGVYSESGEKVMTFNGDSNGNYSIELPIGTYTVKQETGLSRFSETVSISSGQTTVLDIDIDTGIR